MTNTRLVRVTSIRSANPLGYGGCIFYGVAIDPAGSILDACESFVVAAPSRLLSDTVVRTGQWWRVKGKAYPRQRIVNGFRLLEMQIEAEELELTLPSGEHLVTMLSDGELFSGVGNVKARRLWETFGEALYGLLDSGDVNTIAMTRGISKDIAQHLVDGWKLYADTRTHQWLRKIGIPALVTQKLLGHFGEKVEAAIEDDPYRLLSFCANWNVTDRFAREHFGVAEDDPRRLRGAIEEVLYRLFNEGHTAASPTTVMTRLAALFGPHSMSFPWRLLATAELHSAQQTVYYVIGPDGHLQQCGAYTMEAGVARALATRITSERDAPPLLDELQVNEIIAAHESKERLTLTEEQRESIHAAVTRHLVVVTGGAGVGKTTVLKALYRVYDDAGVQVFQAAIAGRAAQRMRAATGKTARTLAGLLKALTMKELSGPCVVVLDEASMVDIVSMYRLCTMLPAHVRLLLIGDPSQLMPVGPGLVLHTLALQTSVTSVELTVIKRYEGAIAQAAKSIRDGTWPELPEDAAAPIAFLRRKSRHVDGDGTSSFPIAETVLDIYRKAPDQTQILCPLKHGPEGVNSLNKLCQSALNADAEKLTVWSEEYECWVDTGFRIGDPLVCKRNLWDIGLCNGSLGRLTKIKDNSHMLSDDRVDPATVVIAWIAWDDDECRPVTTALLNELELAYALTVHKAQGSQWPRIIVPLTNNRLLDRTLIYTAVTRTQQQVILVGDENAARRAVLALPRACHRNTALGSMLSRLLLARDA